MGTLDLDIKDNFLMLSLDVQKLDEKRLEQDLLDKDERSLKNLRIRGKTQQLMINYRPTHESEVRKLNRDSKDWEKRRYKKIYDVVDFYVKVIMTFLLVILATLMISTALMTLNVKNIVKNNNTNSSVAIFTPNGVFEVESYTLNKRVFMGFVKNNNSLTILQNSHSIDAL